MVVVVVVDDVVVVVDDVEVDAAVVTGVVVVVAEGTDVEVPEGSDDVVDPESVVVVSSLPQPVTAKAMMTRGMRRIDFTSEVWHAASRLPDQGVCLVSTFNKL